MVSAINPTLAAADKVHLVNLITTLKSELATTNELLKIKNAECKEVTVPLNCRDDQLLAAQNRLDKSTSAEEDKTVWLAHQLWEIIREINQWLLISDEEIKIQFESRFQCHRSGSTFC